MVNPDLDETALQKLEKPAAVEPEQYDTARATDTGVVMRDTTTEEFQIFFIFIHHLHCTTYC
jgi:hypothetical protein